MGDDLEGVPEEDFEYVAGRREQRDPIPGSPLRRCDQRFDIELVLVLASVVTFRSGNYQGEVPGESGNK